MGPTNALPLGCGRQLNKNIAAAEAIQLIGGFTAPGLLLKASPQFAEYLDGGSFHGAYGARIRYQAANIYTKLREDPDTRQAIITLWDPVLDNQPHKKDYPCTVALGFEIHDSKLCMNTFMRSNDAFLGLPYDMFQFTQLQMSIANALQLDYGWYRHTALSLHIYEKDFTAAQQVSRPTDFSWQPAGVGIRGETFTETMKRARRITVIDAVMPLDSTQSEQWYRERFESYLRPTIDA